MVNKHFQNLRQSPLPLSLATFTVILTPVASIAQTVELAQAPRTDVPSLPSLSQPVPPPQDVVPRSSPPPEFPQTPPASSSPENLLPTKPLEPQQAFPPEVPAEFLVTGFKFEGSTVFTDEQLLEAMKPALGLQASQKLEYPLKITFSQLLEARSNITQLYINNGYITSGALIPEQSLKPEGDVVRIRIVEGSIEDIKVSGTRRLNPNYIRSRLALATGKPLNRERLLEALQLLQQNPRIATISAELAAGTRFGRNLLEVTVTEARTFHGQVSLDNNRSPSVGSFQRSAQLWEDNLLGIGDSVSVSYANTNGSNQVEASYTLPLSPHNTALSFNYSTTFSKVIEEPFDELDISSQSRTYQLTLSHPLVQTPTKELLLGLTLSHQETETELGFKEIGPFPLTPGADEKGRTRISALRFFQQWTQRSDRSVLAFRSQFSVGLDLWDATINEVPPDSRFFAWRGQAQWVYLLAPQTPLILRGDVQLADRRLVSSEQFGLGGQASVRGYRQDAVLADNGAFGSLEVRFPILRISEDKGVLQLIPFVDFGTAWNNYEGADPDPNPLVSAGLGLRLQLSDRLDARLDWGIPLMSTPNLKIDTLQENGLYFSILWNPF